MEYSKIEAEVSNFSFHFKKNSKNLLQKKEYKWPKINSTRNTTKNCFEITVLPILLILQLWQAIQKINNCFEWTTLQFLPSLGD